MRKEKRNSFEVYASRECIDNSERNSLYWCIWALAVIYSIPGAIKVLVDKAETRFTWRGFRYVFPTPDRSARIAKDYDNGIVTKAEISPWRDTLRNPISIEPSQHRRPKKKDKRVAVKRSATCAKRRSSRWNGKRI